MTTNTEDEQSVVDALAAMDGTVEDVDTMIIRSMHGDHEAVDDTNRRIRLQNFEKLLQRQLSSIATTIRQDIREELDQFQKRMLDQRSSRNYLAAEPSLPVKLDGRVTNCVGDKNVDDPERSMPPSRRGSKTANRQEQLNMTVALACAAFQRPVQKKFASHPLRVNVERNEEMASELRQIRKSIMKQRGLEEKEGNKENVESPPDSDKRALFASQGSQLSPKGSSRTGEPLNIRTTQAAMLGHLQSDIPNHLESMSLTTLSVGKSRQRVIHCLASPWFQNIMVAVILLNSIEIAVVSDFMARNVLDNPPSEFLVLEVVFLVIFFFEVVLNLYAHRWDWLRLTMSNGKKNMNFTWNVIDIVTVATQFVDVISYSFTSEAPTKLSFVRTLRLIRLLRVARLLKVVRVIRDLRLIVYSISRSWTVFFWSVVALMLATFLFAIYFTEVVLHYKLRHMDKSTPELDLYFGSLPSSMMSLLQAVTGGVDWGQVFDAINTLDHFMGAFFLIMYIFFALLAMMNIITGVFLHTALDRAKEERELLMMRNARRVFAAADHNGNGMITWEDFERALETSDMHEFFQEIDLEASEAKNLFDLLDNSGDGIISAEEFLFGCLRLRGHAKALDLLVLSREVSSLFTTLASNEERMLLNQQAILDSLGVLNAETSRSPSLEIPKAAPDKRDDSGYLQLPGVVPKQPPN